MSSSYLKIMTEAPSCSTLRASGSLELAGNLARALGSHLSSWHSANGDPWGQILDISISPTAPHRLLSTSSSYLPLLWISSCGSVSTMSLFPFRLFQKSPFTFFLSLFPSPTALSQSRSPMHGIESNAFNRLATDARLKPPKSYSAFHTWCYCAVVVSSHPVFTLQPKWSSQNPSTFNYWSRGQYKKYAVSSSSPVISVYTRCHG